MQGSSHTRFFFVCVPVFLDNMSLKLVILALLLAVAVYAALTPCAPNSAGKAGCKALGCEWKKVCKGKLGGKTCCVPKPAAATPTPTSDEPAQGTRAPTHKNTPAPRAASASPTIFEGPIGNYQKSTTQYEYYGTLYQRATSRLLRSG